MIDLVGVLKDVAGLVQDPMRIFTLGDDQVTLRILGSRIEGNHAREGGGAIFFVSNDRTGELVIEGSVLRANPSDEFETAGFPGIFYLGEGMPRCPTRQSRAKTNLDHRTDPNRRSAHMRDARHEERVDWDHGSHPLSDLSAL